MPAAVRFGASRTSRSVPLVPGVIDIQQQSGTNLLLNVQIANLHIAQPVIRIDRIIVGDAGGRRESILQRQLSGSCLNVGRRRGKWGLQGKFAARCFDRRRCCSWMP